MNKRQHTYPFHWEFTEKNDGSFVVPNAEHLHPLYFPLMNSFGLKSFVTPELKGDIASSFHNYLTTPTVTEELHRTVSGRNFWITAKGHLPWSATGNSAFQKAKKWTSEAEQYAVTGKFGAFETNRFHANAGLETKLTVFVPETDHLVELLQIRITNKSNRPVAFKGTYALPLYGRSADNFRDHRQVTTMFQENYLEKHGVRIKPKIEHDESGHKINHTHYAVLGFDNNGDAPTDIWAKMHDFIGPGGSLDNPQAVMMEEDAPNVNSVELHGKEAIAAFRFKETTLAPEESTTLVIVHGITDNKEDLQEWKQKFGTPTNATSQLTKTLDFWQEKVKMVSFQTPDNQFNNWAKWTNFQLKCRQIFGNSYLPDFGYGRGGRGWRDLWQDLLSIFLVDPDSARSEMLNNFKGIRIDGSNATIIGTKPGEFIADRNNIPRTWADHGAWPVFILNFYIQQSGDYQILFDQLTYWKDRFSHRNRVVDENWTNENENWQLDTNGQVYKGSVFEHVLLQQLSAFYNVGEHNILLLEGADWNDTYDMARDRGESVCFHNFYAYNFEVLAHLLKDLKKQGHEEIDLLEEAIALLDRLNMSIPVDYNSPKDKKRRLDIYFENVQKNVSGKKATISIDELIADLSAKSDHIRDIIQSQEKITTKTGLSFYNGHYDNLGQPIGGDVNNQVQMDLTSQVMPILCNVADQASAKEAYSAVKAVLKDPESPGIRLTTHFKNVDLNVGRITGFVYGYKEHGSKWMQQNIMLAYGLYKQGLAAEGFEVMNDVYSIATNQDVAKNFPGIPSFFDAENRGAYAYLTGSSSWYLLTLTTQMFGIRGEEGNLAICPKLMAKQFDVNGKTSISLYFQNKRLHIEYQNPELFDYNEYSIGTLSINGTIIDYHKKGKACAIIDKTKLEELLTNNENRITVTLIN
ncbi:MAG: hypothetical protein R6U85_12760 [Salinivirgaceae bacterium]